MPNGLSQPIIRKRYYPTLSSVLTPDDIPDVLGFIKDGIISLFDRIYYKDLQYSKSIKGDAAFYSLAIVSPDRLDIELLQTGISLVLNPDFTDAGISSFPITIEYQWKILAYLRAFNTGNFSFEPQGFFELALRVLNITEQQVIEQFINIFVQPSSGTVSHLEQFVTDMNGHLNANIPSPSDQTTIDEVIEQVYIASGSQYSSTIAFSKYLIRQRYCTD